MQAANDLLEGGMAFVTIIAEGRVYTVEEFALTTFPDHALGRAPCPGRVQPSGIRYVGNQTLSPTLAGCLRPHSRKKQEDQSAAECGQPDQRDHEGDIVMRHAHQPSERPSIL